MASTEIRDRRRTLRYRHLLVRQTVQMKNRVSGLLTKRPEVNIVKSRAAWRVFICDTCGHIAFLNVREKSKTLTPNVMPRRSANRELCCETLVE